MLVAGAARHITGIHRMLHTAQHAEKALFICLKILFTSRDRVQHVADASLSFDVTMCQAWNVFVTNSRSKQCYFCVVQCEFVLVFQHINVICNGASQSMLKLFCCWVFPLRGSFCFFFSLFSILFLPKAWEMD